jgi:hypothetical protein
MQHMRSLLHVAGGRLFVLELGNRAYARLMSSTSTAAARRLVATSEEAVIR